MVPVEIDPELATLEHLVHDVLQMELGYGRDISLLIGDRLVYDQEFDDALPDKLFDMGIKNGSFITVKDDNESARVNLDVVIKTRYASFFKNTWQH